MPQPTHPPITSEPRRVRPPYDVPDRTFDQLQLTDPAAWRRARVLDRLAALSEPLAGLDVTDYEAGRLEYLAEGLELHVVAVLAALLWRCRGAAATSTRAACPRCRRTDAADLGSYLECRGCGYGWAPDAVGAGGA